MTGTVFERRHVKPYFNGRDVSEYHRTCFIKTYLALAHMIVPGIRSLTLRFRRIAVLKKPRLIHCHVTTSYEHLYRIEYPT